MKILCLSAHVDDAETGCGGSIAKFIEEGNDIYLAAFSLAEKSLPEGLPKDTLLCEGKTAAKTLGIKPQNLIFYKYPVRELPRFRQEILDDLVKINREIRPDLVFTPSKHDLHQDHYVVAMEGFRAFKFTTVLGYEMLQSSSVFEATSFIVLMEHHARKKLDAISCYKSQGLRVKQLGRQDVALKGAEALMLRRGSQIGVDYAEAFNVMRWITK